MKIALYDGKNASEFEAEPREIEEIFSIAENIPDEWGKNNGAEKLAESIKENINKLRESKP